MHCDIVVALMKHGEVADNGVQRVLRSFACCASLTRMFVGRVRTAMFLCPRLGFYVQYIVTSIE